jgi:quercetin 2,3-dioxygenase
MPTCRRTYCKFGLNLVPSYEQKTFSDNDKRGTLLLVATGMDTGTHSANSVQLNADARIYAGLFDAAETAQLPLDPARKYYVFLVRGKLQLKPALEAKIGINLSAGDAALLSNETLLALSHGQDAEVLVFDLRA